jgi:hypothetical protein
VALHGEDLLTSSSLLGGMSMPQSVASCGLNSWKLNSTGL